MSNNLQFFGEAIRIAFAIFALVFAWQFVFLPTLVDVLRQRLFCVRRELFLMMAHGLVSADSPAYKSLRGHINGLLEYAELATFGRALVTSFVHKDFEDKEQSQWDTALLEISDTAVKEKLMELHSRVCDDVASHMMKTSIIVWLILIVWIPVTTVTLLAKTE